jgi:hypothetical protein
MLRLSCPSPIDNPDNIEQTTKTCEISLLLNIIQHHKSNIQNLIHVCDPVLLADAKLKTDAGKIRQTTITVPPFHATSPVLLMPLYIC